jgi:predicted kinase
VFEASQSVRCADLALLAEADARGRDDADTPRQLEDVELFRLWCAEHGCLGGPRRFGSEAARFEYFHRPGADPDYVPHAAFRCEVVMMSGLPGVGKDRWIETHLPDWPVVSLDALRERLGVHPAEAQGAVLARAREEARAHLKQGRSFVWNATHLTRQVRARGVHLLREYGARIRIVYLDAPEERLLRQNRERPARVPEPVLRRYLERWSVPGPAEAHQVDWVELR